MLADLKATALLKLVYLEMFGHDMSWASFHVLEVMSSPKYLQKRVGYLGAVQSFRPDTEVLMLATNLLKKVEKAGFIFSFRAHNFAGLGLFGTDNDITSHNNSTARHHSLSRHVCPYGSSTAHDPFTSCDSQENHCYSLQISFGISGNAAASMAEDQGKTDG